MEDWMEGKEWNMGRYNPFTSTGHQIPFLFFLLFFYLSILSFLLPVPDLLFSSLFSFFLFLYRSILSSSHSSTYPLPLRLSIRCCSPFATFLLFCPFLIFPFSQSLHPFIIYSSISLSSPSSFFNSMLYTPFLSLLILFAVS